MLEKTLTGVYYSDLILNKPDDYASYYTDESRGILTTYFGDIPNPGEGVLDLRFHEWGGRHFLAGQGHTTGMLRLWNSFSGWVSSIGGRASTGPTFGRSTCLFFDSWLYVVRGGSFMERFSLDNLDAPPVGINTQIGVNGLRFASPSGEIFTGDETYDGRNQPWNLAEYTILDGFPRLVVGQGYDGGAILWNEATLERRVLSPGNDIKWIRAYRDGASISVAIPHEKGPTKLFWFQQHEIGAFPIEGRLPIPPIPPIGGPVQFPDYADNILRKMYDKYKSLAHGSDDDRRELTRMICSTISYYRPQSDPMFIGHKRQKGGPFSKDTAGAYKASGQLILWDLFNGATREPNAYPIQSFDGDTPTQESVTQPPIDYLGAIGTPGPNPPDPTPDPALEARVKVLEVKLAALEAAAIKSGDHLALKTIDNVHYLCAEEAGGGEVNATRVAVGAWETFKAEKQ